MHRLNFGRNRCRAAARHRRDDACGKSVRGQSPHPFPGRIHEARHIAELRYVDFKAICYQTIPLRHEGM